MSYNDTREDTRPITDYLLIQGCDVDRTVAANAIAALNITGLVSSPHISTMAASTVDPTGYISGNTLVIPVGFGGIKEVCFMVGHPRLNVSGADSQDLIEWGAAWTINNAAPALPAELEFIAKENETGYQAPATVGGAYAGSVSFLYPFSEGDQLNFWLFNEGSSTFTTEDFYLSISFRDAQFFKD